MSTSYRDLPGTMVSDSLRSDVFAVVRGLSPSQRAEVLDDVDQAVRQYREDGEPAAATRLLMTRSAEVAPRPHSPAAAFEALARVCLRDPSVHR